MRPHKNLITDFVRQWNFIRSETLELLNSLTDEQLRFIPVGSPKWQPLHFQFSCIGRTQMVYARAIREGKMDFGWFEEEDMLKKKDFITKAVLLRFLTAADSEWLQSIRERRRDEGFVIAWPGYKANLMVHISALVSHERIHHGELISYFTMAGFELPAKFKLNWSL